MGTCSSHPTNKMRVPLPRAKRPGLAFLLRTFLLILLLPLLAPTSSPAAPLDLSRSVVTIYVYGPQGRVQGKGSGVVIGDGSVVTNHHVTEGAPKSRS